MGDEAVNECAGFCAGGYVVGRLLHYVSKRRSWSAVTTAAALGKLHRTESVFSSELSG